MPLHASDDRAVQIVHALVPMNAARLQPLCVGFLTRERQPGAADYTETQYAVLADGRVFVCQVEGYTPHFGKHCNGKLAGWALHVGEIPERAEFFGHYLQPSLN